MLLAQCLRHPAGYPSGATQNCIADADMSAPVLENGDPGQSLAILTDWPHLDSCDPFRNKVSRFCAVKRRNRKICCNRATLMPVGRKSWFRRAQGIIMPLVWECSIEQEDERWETSFHAEVILS